MRTKFWSGNLKETDHSEDLSVDGKVIVERIFGIFVEKVWTGCIWLRRGTSGRLL
jgi:hypothetical protein